jgi:hypothetical protein
LRAFVLHSPKSTSIQYRNSNTGKVDRVGVEPTTSAMP